MTIFLQFQHIETIRDHAEKAYPYECCGLLIGKQTGTDQIIAEIWPAENAWSEETADLFADNFDYAPEHRYTIAPEWLLKAQRETRERNLMIAGIYHSHPNHPAIPSECDRQYAWPEYSYIIVSVKQGKSQDLLCWKLDDTHQFQPERLEILKPAHNPS
jgi:proteasome lid subunit RPN8/RPN11